MARYQFHLIVGDERHAEADPVLIAIVDASDDHAGFEKVAELLPDLEWDCTEVCCDGCSHPVDDCACKPAVTCAICREELDAWGRCQACEARRSTTYLKEWCEVLVVLGIQARRCHMLDYATEDALGLATVESLLEQTA